ncbi:MAG: HAD-IA family hydrolase [Erysipelotrichaceae bacterium]|nr:HAD-IA family hydrolase [Erysipelotrichaceae bacterium]
MIKGLIFDLDGTTLNTLLDMHECINMTMRDFGFPEKTYDEVRMGVGRGYRVLVQSCLPKGSNDELIDKATEVYKAYYAKYCNVKTVPYEGVKELLNKLQEKGIKMGVNSNKGDDLTKQLTIQNFPEIDFVDIIGSRKDIPNKPDPYSANEIMEKMGLNKDEVLYIGDSESDILTGHNAGLKVVGCAYGFRDAEVLVDNGADYLIETPLELLDII